MEASGGSKYLGGLKVAAQVTGLSFQEDKKCVAVAVSRLDGDVWDGCVELWALEALDQEGAVAARGDGPTKGCVGRLPTPCGIGPLCWVAGSASKAKPLLAYGRDDGNVELVVWESKKAGVAHTLSMTEHDGLVTCLLAGDEGLLASGAADGSVRVWETAATIPQASAATLPCPFGGANVSCMAAAPWANASLSVLLVCYGGAAGACAPCLCLWDRSKGKLEPPTITMYPTALPPSEGAPAAAVSPRASPLCCAYSSASPHAVWVGFDDGSLAKYDDAKLGDGPLLVTAPHGTAAVRALVSVSAGGVVSCGEDGRAVLVGEDGACGACAVDGRDDFILSAASVRVGGAQVAVLTGGMDGQVRLTSIEGNAATA